MKAFCKFLGGPQTEIQTDRVSCRGALLLKINTNKGRAFYKMYVYYFKGMMGSNTLFLLFSEKKHDFFEKIE